MKKIIAWSGAIVFLLTAVLFISVEVNRRTLHGKLDRRAALVLMIARVAHTPLHSDSRPVGVIRKSVSKSSRLLQDSKVEVGRVYDHSFRHKKYSEKIILRVYEPKVKGPWPIIIYYHGGGWVIGSLESHDHVGRKLCRRSASLVVSVDYRLAPEYPYPAAMDDALGALAWIYKNAGSMGGDKNRIALAGDSAGGNLAIVTALEAAVLQIPLRAAALFYPVTEISSLNRESYKKYSRGFLLEKKDMQWFIDQYVPDLKDRLNPGVSPLHLNTLDKMPDVYIATAQFDVLHDEGILFVEKMKHAGVSVKHHDVPGMVHGFISYPRIFGLGDDIITEASLYLKKKLR